MDTDAIDLDEFEAMVEQALTELPDWIQDAVAGIAIMVDDQPPRDRPGTGLLLGQFHGVARTRIGGRVPGSLPDRIELYRVPILRVSATREDVAARVRKVLGHEIGHAFGLGDSRLRELGWY
ncbi:metallopeptidase family protein [Jiangella asiatica]|uniref:Metallopeptidase family protein n=1 Tax=Jiangella asiatica TaxID=2530372 RepID=A0A4R5DCP3_9ACTN|nr:metallopeptidase family protein [Jiangella asiatica]TDE08033.1 metallopeptidase family protein [Jiangella asiatica]